MVRRDEVGTGNDYMVEQLEDEVKKYWEEEKDIVEAFQAMMHSLTDMGDGVFVDTGSAMINEERGQEYIANLAVDKSHQVSQQPFNAKEFFFVKRPQKNKSAFFGVYFTSLDLTQFLFQKFGYWWLISVDRSAIMYHVYMFKTRPKSLWFSGGGAIKGQQGLSDPKSWSRVRRLGGWGDLFQEWKGRFTVSSPLQGEPDDWVDEVANFSPSEGVFKNQWGAYDNLYADACWKLYFKRQSQGGKRKDMPSKARIMFGKEGADPNEYVAWDWTSLEVERQYGMNLSTFGGGWTFDYEESVESMGYSDKQQIYLKKMLSPYKGYLNREDYWGQFHDDMHDNKGGFHARELTFNYPTVYQYKTQFGVLNQAAV